MNPELQKMLVEIIQQTRDLAAREIPLVLRDLLTAGVIEATVVALVSVIVLGGALLLFRSGLRHEKQDYSDDFKGFGIGVGGGIAALAVAVMLMQTAKILTIYIAPRAYLLDLVRSR